MNSERSRHLLPAILVMFLLCGVAVAPIAAATIHGDGIILPSIPPKPIPCWDGTYIVHCDVEGATVIYAADICVTPKPYRDTIVDGVSVLTPDKFPYLLQIVVVEAKGYQDAYIWIHDAPHNGETVDVYVSMKPTLPRIIIPQENQ